MSLTRFIFANSLVLFSFLVIASAAASDYSAVVTPKSGEVLQPEPGDHVVKPEPEPGEVIKPQSDYVPEPEEEESFSVEGFVLCKLGLQEYPIEGAMVNITCMAVDEDRYERVGLSMSSCPSDEKGYFFGFCSQSTLHRKVKPKECKAFISSSPWETCNVPTDVNKGISGANLSAYRLLEKHHRKLYSIGPFFFRPESKPVPN